MRYTHDADLVADLVSDTSADVVFIALRWVCLFQVHKLPRWAEALGSLRRASVRYIVFHFVTGCKHVALKSGLEMP